jgi:hypothetical protein
MKSKLLVLSLFGLAVITTATTFAQDLWPDYAGSARCRTCHAVIRPIDLAEFDKSGHPWKIQRIDRSKVGADGVYRPFPAGTNVAGIPLAPEAIAGGFSYTAADTNIAFMIGGFGWKARWMNRQGYIYEGTKAQYNIGTIHPTLKNHGPYGAANVGNRAFSMRDTVAQTGLAYTCGACHTTGWKPYHATNQPKRFEDRPGFGGTFLEFGVQCEACHGPGKAHADAPTRANIFKSGYDGTYGCIACHARGGGTRIPVKSGAKFLDHREQFDQMQFTKHRRTARMTCVTCHDPHKSTVYDRGGLKTEGKTCQPCHPGKAVSMTVVRDGVPRTVTHTCQDCHMPYIGSTAIEANDYRADQASHMWKINTDPVGRVPTMWPATGGNVIIPADSIVAHTLDFACLGCHTTKTLAWASSYAKGIHAKNIVVNVETQGPVIPSAYYVEQNYPNPFNPSTTIRFGLPEPSNVRLDVYDMTGKHIATLVSKRLSAGIHSVTWNGTDESGKAVASGVYLYRLETDKFIDSKRMVLTK